MLCGLIGGVLGVVIAGLGEADALRDLGALPTLVIGLIEEAAKLIVPLAVLLFTR
jgi:protease PrsW